MAALSRLTDRSAVLKAIAECDALGREAFLSRYHFQPARTYHLVHDGRRYDSKAIVGVAWGYQFPDEGALTGRHKGFSGGEATVARVLRRLKFDVERVEPPSPLATFRAGQVYDRQTDIHRRYGGQERGGISTPADHPYVFLFTGKSGHAFGYEDGWVDGIYRYTGEGQEGDMTFSKGNLAIRDHAQNGRDLLLFESLGKGRGIRFVGVFSCAAPVIRSTSTWSPG